VFTEDGELPVDDEDLLANGYIDAAVLAAPCPPSTTGG
jgi:hypothetical protein